MGREGEVVQALIPAFERENPGVQVRVQRIPWSAAHEKLLTAHVAGALPDVFQLGNTWIPEFIILHALEPLDDWLTASNHLTPTDYFAGIWETNRLDHILYGIPWYVDTRLLFYRTDLLEQAGVATPISTWAAWLAAMHKLKALPQTEYALLLPLNEPELLIILALQQGAGLLKDGARFASFQDPAFRQALAYYLELFRQALAPVVGSSQVANLYQEFARGYFAMYVSGPWNIGEFKQRLPQALQDQWQTAALPAPQGGYPGVSLAGGASLVLARTSNHKAAAWRLIEYLSRPEVQVKFYELTGDLPAHRAAWKSRTLAENPHTQAFGLQLQNVVPTPQIPEWERIKAKLAQYAEAIIRAQLTPDEALARLDQEVNRMLEKRRFVLERQVEDLRS